MLRPFGGVAKIYDPYLKPGALDRYEFAKQVGFEDAMNS